MERIPTFDEIRAQLRPDTKFDPTGTFDIPEQKYQATLYVTDEQMVILNRLVEMEWNRVNRELGKPQTSKQLKKLEFLKYDLQEIKETMKENVW